MIRVTTFTESAGKYFVIFSIFFGYMAKDMFRTARGAAGKGKSLMFLQPSEIGFLKHCKEARIPLVEFEVPAKKIVNVQSQLEKLISENYYLNKVCTVLYQKFHENLR